MTVYVELASGEAFDLWIDDVERKDMEDYIKALYSGVTHVEVLD